MTRNDCDKCGAYISYGPYARCWPCVRKHGEPSAEVKQAHKLRAKARTNKLQGYLTTAKAEE